VCLHYSSVYLSQDIIERIGDFLSKFVGPASSDVTDGIADMDIGDQDSDPETERMRGLKYMSQLVRQLYISFSVRLSSSAATYREPRPTDACH